MMHWQTFGRSVRSLTPLLRVGWYTDHPFREAELTVVLGLSVDFDLTALHRSH